MKRRHTKAEVDLPPKLERRLRSRDDYHIFDSYAKLSVCTAVWLGLSQESTYICASVCVKECVCESVRG